jgi:hypothetical protein
MRAVACRFLRGYCYLYLQFILLQNWVPRCTYHFALYCGTYYVKLTFYSCFDPFFLRSWSFSGGGAFHGCCGGCCPPELLVVLPASVSLSSTCRIHYGLLSLPSSTGTSPTTPRPPSEGLYFSLSYSQFSLEMLHACLRRNEVRFCLLCCCDVKVLICGDHECVNI